MTLMSKIHKDGFLISTPSQDYDDSYCIQYAKKMNAFIVTNDKFRDYIDGLFTNLSEGVNQPKKGKTGKKSGGGKSSP